MAQTEFKFEFQTNPKNREQLQYRLYENGSPVEYLDGSSLVNKRFIETENESVGFLGVNERDLDLSIISTEISTNSPVLDLIHIPAFQERPALIAMVGNFTQYTRNEINTTANKLVIVYDDPENNYPIYHGNNLPFNEEAVISTLDYNVETDELVLGGEDMTVLGGNSISNIVFFSVGNKSYNVDKNTRLSSAGGINDKVNVIKYNPTNGLVVFGGAFTDYCTTGSGYLGALNDLGVNSEIFPSNATVGGEVKDIEMLANGQFYIVGNFGTVNGQSKIQMALMDSDGASRNEFNSGTSGFTGDVNSILVDEEYNIFVGGRIFEYNGNEVGSLVKLSPEGVLDISFNERFLGGDYSDMDIFRMQLDKTDFSAEGERLYLMGEDYVTKTGLNIRVNELEGKVTDELYYTGTIGRFVFSPINDLLLAGGSFESWDNSSVSPSDDDVTIEPFLTATLDNLITKLQSNNQNIGVAYELQGTDVIVKYTHRPGVIISIGDIRTPGDVIAYSYPVTGYNENIERLKPLLLRSDYVMKGDSSNFTSVDFIVRTYGNGVVDTTGIQTDSEVNKPKLSAEQTNQWINVSPLVDKSFLNPEVYVQRFFLSISKLTPTFTGRYGIILANNKLSTATVQQKIDNVFILDGFKDKSVTYSSITNILMNGRYREVTVDSKIKIPINMYKINRVTITNEQGNQVDFVNFLTEPNYNDPSTRDGFLNYFTFNSSLYANQGNIFTLKFEGDKEYNTGEVKVRIRKNNCLVDTTEVAFVNRWGILEGTQMIGQLDESIRVKSKRYKRSIRDINGYIDSDKHSIRTSSKKHSIRTFSKNGETEYVYNTGSVSEKMNPLYDDLIMSEKVWIKIDNDAIPVYVDKTNFRKKTELRDSNIDYNFTFKEANNKVKVDI